MPRPPRRRVPVGALTVALAVVSAACSSGSSPTSSPGAASTAAATGAPNASGLASAAPSGTPLAPIQSPDRGPGTTRTDDAGVSQVWVPGGVFKMGAEAGSATPPAWATNEARSEQPQHEVAISRGYWIDATEVTVASFAAFKAAGGYDELSLWSEGGWTWRQRQGEKPLPAPCLVQAQDQPQVCVTWWEAEAYATWRGGRLPTEAEWEFAARGPESRIYPWGDDFDPALANLDGGTGPVAVGSYPGGASWVGALDLSGNAMEWVADWFSLTYYREEIRDDPRGPDSGSIKVEKGGWWGPADDAGAYVGRAAYRHFEDPPFYQDHHIGFRIVSFE